jgi:hypothetical protein
MLGVYVSILVEQSTLLIYAYDYEQAIKEMAELRIEFRPSVKKETGLSSYMEIMYDVEPGVPKIVVLRGLKSSREGDNKYY